MSYGADNPEIVGPSYPQLEPGYPTPYDMPETQWWNWYLSDTYTPPPDEGFRRGSRGRVPKTKRYLLHEGEGVMPRSEMRKLSRRRQKDLTTDDGGAGRERGMSLGRLARLG